MIASVFDVCGVDALGGRDGGIEAFLADVGPGPWFSQMIRVTEGFWYETPYLRPCEETTVTIRSTPSSARSSG